MTKNALVPTIRPVVDMITKFTIYKAKTKYKKESYLEGLIVDVIEITRFILITFHFQQSRVKTLARVKKNLLLVYVIKSSVFYWPFE